MRADRPVLAAAVFLASGLSILFCYGTASSGLSAALPLRNSDFHLTLITSGGPALGGVILTIIGVLFLIWAIVAAITWHFRLLLGKERSKEKTVDPRSQTHAQT